MAGETSSGTDDSKLFAVLAYFLGIVGFIIAYLMKKDDKYIMFHAYQSLFFGICMVIIYVILGIGQFAVGLIPTVGGLISCLLGICFMLFGLVIFVVWLFLMWKAWSGEKYKLPIIGDQAEKFAG